jgi:protein-S-isoprenylcysteine O-methyltransferase Ste14
MQWLFTTRICAALTACYINAIPGGRYQVWNMKDTIRRLQRFASTPFRAVVIISVILLVIGWLMGYLRLLDAALGAELPAWVQLPGIVAVVAGAALALICGAMLSTRGIGTLAGEEWFMPREFVATGPFRFVRNPMSLGGVVLLTGIALWHLSAFGLGLAAAVFLVAHLVVVYAEEPGLEKRFGDSYREYRRNVRRWLPRVTPWQPIAADQASRGRQ